MSKTTFVPGTQVLPSFLNSFQSIFFDDLDLDGHYPPLGDEALSSAPGSLKTLWNSFRNALGVSAGTGLNVSIAAGSVSRDNNAVSTVAATQRSLPPNTTTFVWVDEAAAIQTGATLPVRSVPLAEVVTLAASISSISDLRPRFRIQPVARALLTFGGASTTDFNYVVNQTTEGRLDCRNLTVSNGVTLTVPSGFLHIVASGDVTINGTITVAAPISGGFGFTGAGIVQQYVSETGRGIGGGGGHNGSGAPKYPHTASFFGSGGSSGFSWVYSSPGGLILSQSRGGYGGGAVIIQAAGKIIINGAIYCDGGAGSIGSTSGTGSVANSGSGGGSGGLIWAASLTSITAAASAQLSVRGGRGGDGQTQSYTDRAAGGGGGGGGYIVTTSPNNNLTGATLTLSGGLPGTSSPGVSLAVAGGAGGSYAGVGATSLGTGGTGLFINQVFTPA